ncbi:MAG: T9SS type A sorting domain-containing protein [Chitinophagales bacterium]|nr:T9SS type A sorting domain-containing protein [Chitinophagales bacterium]
MKKNLLLLLVAVLTSIAAQAAKWNTIGSAGFSVGATTYNSSALDGTGNPVVAFSDGSNSYKATVMRYNGSSWVTVGTAGFSAGFASYVSLALDGTGNPVVAYRDGSNSQKATVMRYNGSSWVTVGTAGFSAGPAGYVSLALDGTGNPVVAYSDGSNNNKATVMRYNGSSWVTVGTAVFSVGSAWHVSLALDGTGNPFVAYQDWGNSQKATVMKYDGTSWVTVGTAGFSAGLVDYVSLALDVTGNPVVAYSDVSNSDKVTVMRYNGSSWVTVGTAGFSAGAAFYTSLALDGTGNPVVAFQDGSNSNKAAVMRYNGSSWVTVGTAGISAGATFYTSLALDGTGNPVVAYRDVSNSDKATVMRYRGEKFVSAQSGNYTASSTWLGGMVPPTNVIDDTVVINTGHTVTYSSGALIMESNTVVDISGTLVLDQADAVINDNSIFQYTNTTASDKGLTFNNANGYRVFAYNRTKPLDLILNKNIIPTTWPSSLEYHANGKGNGLLLYGSVAFDTFRVSNTAVGMGKDITQNSYTQWYSTGLIETDPLYGVSLYEDSRLSIIHKNGEKTKVTMIDPATKKEKVLELSSNTGSNYEIYQEDGIKDGNNVDISLTRPAVTGTIHISTGNGTGDANIEVCYDPAMEVNSFDDTKGYISHYDGNTKTWDSQPPQAVTTSGGKKCLTRNNVTTFSPFAIFDVNTRPNNLSVSELTERISTSISLYPNPTTGILNVMYTGKTKTVEVLIYNVAGSYIGSYTMMNGVASINVSAFNAGNYYLVLKDEGQLRTQQFIKQ